MIFYQINAELQNLNCRYSELEMVIKNERDVSEEIIELEEKLEHRVFALEEEVETLKTQNFELRHQLNNITVELNCVIDLLNTRYE